ncbi:MAG: hypothetical protein QOJ12_2436, partial [Thermoleophilales bacterium]|nr:hypothetical protein [Thermoleophilales bacterium]
MHARKATARLLSRHDVSVRLGASLFLAGAVLSVATMLGPHSPKADEVGFYWLGLVELAIGVAALALPPRVARRFTPPLFPIAGVLVVTATL